MDHETQGLENTLRDLWIRIVEEGEKIRVDKPNDTIRLLIENGYARVQDGFIELTEKGLEAGRKLVRLHRLTERLLFDVLGAEEEVYERVACEMEHVIPEELEEAICTLLGHPTKCPHGKPIPPGRCCLERRSFVPTLVHPLTELAPGTEAKISYMDVPEETYTRLIGLGLAPGKRIKIHQTKPTTILSTGDTQVAIDRDTASRIYAVALHVPREQKEQLGRHRWRLRIRHRGGRNNE